jgi:hypothetical protein
MFISSNEKRLMLLRIETLESRVETLSRSLNAVLDKLTGPAESLEKLIKANRAKRNAYASAYYYKKKAEKAVQSQPKE